MGSNIAYVIRIIGKTNQIVDETTKYIIELFYFRLEQSDYNQAKSLLKLLAKRLPASELTKLNAELSRTAIAIRSFAHTRKIKHIVHFTRIENVTSILQHGLVPRSQLEVTLGSLSRKVITNDQLRLDRHHNASCLSVSFPNYRLFYRYRLNNVNARWAVLLINPSILWQKNCAFCLTNAASKQISETSVSQLSSFAAFKSLFGDYRDGKTLVRRADISIPPFFTTNPQAEILVFDVIEVEYIMTICLQDPGDLLPAYKKNWGSVPVCFEPLFFTKRVDYTYWSTDEMDPKEGLVG